MKKSKVVYTAVLALLIAIATAMVVIFAVMSGSEGENPDTAMKYYDLAAGFTYALLIVTGILMVTFPILRIVQNFKTYLKTLTGIVIVALVFLLAYLLSPAVTGEFYTSHEIGPYLSRFINAGLITTYVVMVAGIAVLVYTEISERIK